MPGVGDYCQHLRCSAAHFAGGLRSSWTGIIADEFEHATARTQAVATRMIPAHQLRRSYGNKIAGRVDAYTGFRPRV